MDEDTKNLNDKYTSLKTYAMIVIGILATLAIVSNGIFAWFYSPQDQQIINSIIEFLKNIVLTVIGYLAGASRPDDPVRLSTLVKKNATIDTTPIDTKQD